LASIVLLKFFVKIIGDYPMGANFLQISKVTT